MRRIIPVFLICTFLFSACSLPNLAAGIVEEVGDAVDSSTDTEEETAVLLFGIGMHVEPFGETAQGIMGSIKMDYNQPQDFLLHVKAIRAVADIVESHDGVITIQAQSPFTSVLIENGDTLLSDLAAEGNEIALHFHEDSHLGNNPANLSVKRWCTVMTEEINLLKIASGVEEINYWSGGNLYQEVYEAATCAGLSINSDWKSPATQTTDTSLYGIHPWRPTGGTDGSDFSLISSHDPDGEIIFLPEGQFEREDSSAMKGNDEASDQAYLDYIESQLLASLAAAEAGKVNVFHITMHPDELSGDPNDQYALLDLFLTDVIDPLVASGQVKWATYSDMADAYQTWEDANPGVDPR